MQLNTHFEQANAEPCCCDSAKIKCASCSGRSYSPTQDTNEHEPGRVKSFSKDCKRDGKRDTAPISILGARYKCTGDTNYPK